MRAIVIDPPDALMSPADIPGSHAPDDATVAAWIASATSILDGPNGWLGRALGVQKLKLTAACFPCSGKLELICPPVIEIESITYVDTAGDEQELPTTSYDLEAGREYVVFNASASLPATAARPDAVRIVYTAGYDGVDVEAGGTGDVPQRVKQAIQLQVQHFMSSGTGNLFLRRVRVDDVGEREYVVSDQAERVISSAVKSLVGGLRKIVV